jgi:spore germination protein KB
MMEQQTGKIGIREYIAILLLVFGTKMTDDTPALLYDKLENAAWMAPIITGSLSIIPIYLLLKVLSYYPNKSLMDVIQKTFGKPIGFIIVFSLWFVGSSAVVIDSAIYTDIIGTMYFTRTPTIVLYTILMLVSAYGAKKGIEQIGSVAIAVITYIKISLLIALLLTFFHGQVEFLFPIFGPGKWEIVKESSLKLSIFGDILYIGAIATYIKSSKDFRIGTWISLIILMIEIPVAIAAYLFLFDYESVKMLNYPFHETIRYISVGFLSNLETFFFPFWLVATFIRFSIYLYLSAIIFGWLFKIKEFGHIIPTLATLFVVLGMIPETPTFSIFYIREKVLNIITPFFFFLPILLWIVAKFKGVYHNEKNL